MDDELTCKVIAQQAVDQLWLDLSKLPEKSQWVLVDWLQQCLLCTQLLQANVVFIGGQDPCLWGHAERLPGFLCPHIHEEMELMALSDLQRTSIDPCCYSEQLL